MDKVLFTGGGTGGHTMPIIAIAREMKRLVPNIELHYIGLKLDFESLSQEGFKLHSILGGKIRRYFSLLNIVDIFFKIPLSFLQSFFILLFTRPDLVFSKGGTGSLPVTFCARLLRIPVFIHESDSTLGLSNKITSKWAKKVFTSFPPAVAPARAYSRASGRAGETTELLQKEKIEVVGNPIRRALLQGNKEEARKALNITSQKPVMLILGGSQGAQAINEFILSILNKLLEQYEIIQVVGPKNHKAIMMQSAIFLPNKELLHNYHLYEFLNEVELKNAYWASDIVVSRAGSGSIFELSALGKPSILIPLPGSAHNHQSKNAYQYANSGGSIVLEQESLAPGFFMGEVKGVLSRKEDMKNSALKFAKPEAAERISSGIIKFIDEPR